MEPIPEVSDGLTSFERSVMKDWEVIYYDPKVFEADILVTDVDLRIKSNTEKHKTDEYDITSAEYYDNVEQLVVRRGEPFYMEIQFDRHYDKTKHDVRLVFEFGKDPKTFKGSRVELKPSDAVTPDKWCAVIESNDETTLKLSVFPPPDCAVAKWSLKIDTVVKGGDDDTKTKLFRYKHSDPIYILFNPWCEGDGVYMNTEESEEDNKEYVMNEKGELYRGSQYNISRCSWEFGQFTGKVLECVMYLLDTVSNLEDHYRGNPVEVTREISSLVNNCDNNGVLAGKWGKEEEYVDGKKPWEWVSSTTILEQYYDTKQPVKYGQCWVFSAVVTSVCRALGIPTRSVTNFASAHDTDGSITIDNFVDSEGKEMKGDEDSVWNFHVWNECWMARPDLSEGYGGWQAVDATPQERSNGKFQMGPAPVKAIKEGNMNCQYDGPFVFGEVNGDRVTWGPDDNGNVQPLEIEEHSVGKYISTKKRFDKGAEWSWVNRFCPYREDITDTYKFREGSTEERDAVKRAGKNSTKPSIYKEGKKEFDVAFELDIGDETKEKQDTFIGETVNIRLMITNKGKEERYISGNIDVESTDYRGRSGKSILNHRLTWQEANLKPKEVKKLNFNIPVGDYYEKLMDQNFIKARCLCRIKKTQQIFSAHKTIELLKPNLTIKAPEKGRVKESFKAEATFVNPLPFSLTECEVIVEGPGLQVPSTLAQPDVPPNGTFKFETEFTPMKTGEKAIIIVLNSKLLHSIQGEKMINISK